MARTGHELTSEELLIVEDLSNLSGNAGKVPVVNVTEDGYDFQVGAGDVTGPASSTDNVVARFHLATGKIIQDSAVTIADTTGDITGGKYNTVAISGSSTPTLAVTGTTTVSGANTGDQTSIVGITGTKAQFNTACTDGDFIYSGDSATLATITTTGNIELGHASDTTLSRVSAGVLAVEGIPAIIAGSTTVGQVPTITGTNTYSWQTPSAGGGFWTAMAGTPVRASNTTFTVTGDITTYVAKGMIIKWTESSAVKCAMVSIPSTYSAPNTTITIIGDTMASIDASSLKYATLPVEIKDFNIAGTIGATGTDVARAYYAPLPMRVIGADLQAGTAGTTNSTTVDINKGGTTMFTTKPTLATTVASSPLPFTADSATSLALGDKVTIDIDAIQTTSAIDLYVQLYLFPTRYLSLA